MTKRLCALLVAIVLPVGLTACWNMEGDGGGGGGHPDDRRHLEPSVGPSASPSPGGGPGTGHDLDGGTGGGVDDGTTHPGGTPAN